MCLKHLNKMLQKIFLAVNFFTRYGNGMLGDALNFCLHNQFNIKKYWHENSGKKEPYLPTVSNIV